MPWGCRGEDGDAATTVASETAKAPEKAVEVTKDAAKSVGRQGHQGVRHRKEMNVAFLDSLLAR